MFRGLSPSLAQITQGTESVRRDLVDFVAKTEVSWTTGGLAGSKSTSKRPEKNDRNDRPATGAFCWTETNNIQWLKKASVNYRIIEL